MTQMQEINACLSYSTPLLDVRSPAEFFQGHIPGAVSFPLFSDSERVQVGTLYKERGKDAAVKLGLSFVGPKLSSFHEQAENITFGWLNLVRYSKMQPDLSGRMFNLELLIRELGPGRLLYGAPNPADSDRDKQMIASVDQQRLSILRLLN